MLTKSMNMDENSMVYVHFAKDDLLAFCFFENGKMDCQNISVVRIINFSDSPIPTIQQMQGGRSTMRSLSPLAAPDKNDVPVHVNVTAPQAGDLAVAQPSIRHEMDDQPVPQSAILRKAMKS